MLNKKGISLPMIIGLVSLLMVASVAANEMVIRTLHSVRRIESADRAYFVAEAGIEDALYELSPHFAGYETPDLGDSNARNSDFNAGGNIDWTNEWTIRSHDEDGDPNIITGRIYEDQKLILSLFNDTSGDSSPGTNAINSETLNPDTDIEKLVISGGNITFRIPTEVYTDNPAFGGADLTIDNDGDLLSSTPGYNEDPATAFGGGDANACPYLAAGVTNGDDDCDGRENEDSAEDPVIYWKITDDEGNSLEPKTGCITDGGSEICEKDFTSGGDYSVSLDGTTEGSGDIMIGNFIQDTCGDKCQLEFLVVAPLEQVHTGESRKIDIPYLEYELSVTSLEAPPLPYFTLKSDGYYQDYKQSITTTVYPKTAVPLFDFTIVQQQ